MNQERDLFFWLRWVVANALAEAIGLGAAFLIGFGLLSRSEDAPISLLAGGAVLLGTLEGIVVGLAQGSVLRRRLPQITLARWVAATALGAFVAWTLGMIPSTLMSMAPGDPASAPPEMPQAVIYLLAVGMGALLGPVLACAQWIVLRRWVARAWRWIPANALAWMLGMPLIFVGTGFIQPEMPAYQAALIMLAAVTMAGAAVGAVHGLILVRALLR
jgi:hypothetical protein